MTNNDKQISLFEGIYSEKVRRAEIDSVMHFSIYDVLQNYGSEGSAKNPHVYWEHLQRCIKSRGAKDMMEMITYQQFARCDGKMNKLTPIAPLKFFLRVAQISEMLAGWWQIREWIAQSAEDYLLGIDSDPVENFHFLISLLSKKPEPAKCIPGFVYLFRNLSGLCKIGITIDLDKRRKELEKEHGTLELLAVIKTNEREKLEKELHARYSHKHHHLEWFDLSSRDIRKFKALAKQCQIAESTIEAY